MKSFKHNIVEKDLYGIYYISLDKRLVLTKTKITIELSYKRISVNIAIININVKHDVLITTLPR